MRWEWKLNIGLSMALHPEVRKYIESKGIKVIEGLGY